MEEKCVVYISVLRLPRAESKSTSYNNNNRCPHPNVIFHSLVVPVEVTGFLVTEMTEVIVIAMTTDITGILMTVPPSPHSSSMEGDPPDVTHPSSI